jgi:hypothetical protein
MFRYRKINSKKDALFLILGFFNGSCGFYWQLKGEMASAMLSYFLAIFVLAIYLKD